MKKVPYFSKQMNWRESGAGSKSEFDDWNQDLCGIYCLKMAGDYFGQTNELSVWELLETCNKFGGFKEENGVRIGVFHQALVKTAREFGLSGKVIKRLNIEKIKKFLEKDYLVILSIDKSQVGQNQTGGHLVLVTNFDVNNNTFVINDPDPILARDGLNIKITEVKLNEISNQKGVVVKATSDSAEIK